MLWWLACGGPPDPFDRVDPLDPTNDTDSAVEIPADAVVLPAVELRDVSGARRATVVVVGDHIHAVLAPDVVIPAEVRVLDVQGAYVTPGLIDPHVHLSLSATPDFVGDTLADNLRAMLAYGVTSAVDAGGPTWTYGLRDRIDAGEILGPSLRTLGPFVTVPGSHPCELWDDSHRCTWGTADGAEGRARVAAGADGVKLVLADADFTPWPTPALPFDAAEAEAAPVLAAGGLVYAHIDQAEDAIDALHAGATVLAHPPFDVSGSPLLAELATRAPVHSTIGAFAAPGDLAGLPYDDAVFPALMRDDWAFYRDNPEWLGELWIASSAGWAAAATDNLVALRELGATVVPASDAGYSFVPFGWGLHRELRLLVAAGWSPASLVAAATAGAAAQAGWTDRGAISPGMRADLLVVDADPFVSIATLEHPEWVIVAGQAWSPAALRAVEVRSGGSAIRGAFCVNRDDCGAPDATECDLLFHRCEPDCPFSWQRTGACDAASFCAPVDGWLANPDGVCRTVDRCDPYRTSCEPAWYAETCVPGDLDTFYCAPSGPRLVGESCDDASNRCSAGLFCSFLDRTCYQYCDPAAPSCDVGTCVMQEVAGRDWFGLCL
jgi:imidazolonepropionase-like amidohydrolase